MPGRYIVKSAAAVDSRGMPVPRDVTGAEAAAAEAMEMAQRCKNGYQIFASRRVIDCIPEDMRGREHA
jgi:hypothetical protein